MERNSSGVPRWLAWPWFILAAVFLLPALSRDGMLVLTGIRTTGEVVRIEESTRVRAPATPVVRFRTTTGREVEFRGFAQSGRPYAIRDRVAVIYPSAEPSGAQIQSPAFWRGLTIALVIGIVALAAGIAILRR